MSVENAGVGVPLALLLDAPVGGEVEGAGAVVGDALQGVAGLGVGVDVVGTGPGSKSACCSDDCVKVSLGINTYLIMILSKGTSSSASAEPFIPFHCLRPVRHASR